MNVYDCTIEHYGVILWYGVIPIVCHTLQAAPKNTKQILCILKQILYCAGVREGGFQTDAIIILITTFHRVNHSKCELAGKAREYFSHGAMLGNHFKRRTPFYVLLSVIEFTCWASEISVHWKCVTLNVIFRIKIK